MGIAVLTGKSVSSIVTPPFFKVTSTFSVSKVGIVGDTDYTRINTPIGNDEIFNANVGLGTDSFFMINNPIKDSQYHLIKFQYGVFINVVQFLLNEVKGTLEDITSENILILRNALSKGDEAFSSLVLKNSMPDSIQESQILLQMMSDSIQSNVFLLNTLSYDEISAIHAVLNSFDAVTYISNILLIKQSFSDVTSVFYETSINIYLDNVLIDKWIGNNTVELSFSQSSIHNEISISSISQDLFNWADPSINSGTPRIEVHIGNRVLFFLLETRSGSGTDFTLWGRDQTARDSSPWASSDSLYLSENKLASEVVASIPIYSAVDWDAGLYDWILPESFETEGTPSEILSAIAQEIGGIVRSQDDGSFLIRKRYTVRPFDMGSYIADTTYTANHVVDFSHSKSIGDHFNKVSVTSLGPDSILPTIEIEDLSDGVTRSVGTTSFAKVYWTDTNSKVQSTYVTDGSIFKIIGPFDNGSFREEQTEIIVFENGLGDTSYPIFDLGTIEWIGDSGNIVDWNKYEKTLTLENLNAFKLAKVTYTTEYQRYELSGHSVEELLAVFYYNDPEGLTVTVNSAQIAFDENDNLIDKVGDTITTDNLKLDSTAAVERGKAWIDSNKYDSCNHNFISPYRDIAKDGKIAWIDCERIGLTGNYYISDVGIIIEGAKVINTLKVIQWEI